MECGAMNPAVARFLFSVAHPSPGLVLSDLLDNLERICARDLEKAARNAGTLAGNAMRINLREGHMVIR